MHLDDKLKFNFLENFYFVLSGKGQPTIFQPLANYNILNLIYDIFWERHEGRKSKFVIALECKHQHKMNERGCCLDRRRANRWGGGGAIEDTREVHSGATSMHSIPGHQEDTNSAHCTVVPPACQAASEGTVFQEDTNSVPAHS